MPGLTLDTDAHRAHVIYVSKHPGFVDSVIPAQARKHADILSDFLFEVEPKAKFMPLGVGQVNVCIRGVKCRLIVAELPRVDIAQNASSTTVIVDAVPL